MVSALPSVRADADSDGGLQRGKDEYNIVLVHPDDGSVESWTAEGSADKMRADFADYEPR